MIWRKTLAFFILLHALLSTVWADNHSTLRMTLLGHAEQVDVVTFLPDENQVLSGSAAVDKQGAPLSTQSLFSGGFFVIDTGNPVTVMDNEGNLITVNDYLDQGNMNNMVFGDYVSIVGHIDVDPAHIGQAAEIMVFAGNRAPQITRVEPTTWYSLLDTRREDGNAHFDFWTRTFYDAMGNDDGFNAEDLARLPTFMRIDALQANLAILLWSGGLVDGTLKIYFGYRLLAGDMAGTVIINAEPILITIDNSANPFHVDF